LGSPTPAAGPALFLEPFAHSRRLGRRYPIVNRFRDQGNVAQMPDASIAPAKSTGMSERFEE
jgi:hypothetical protein